AAQLHAGGAARAGAARLHAALAPPPVRDAPAGARPQPGAGAEGGGAREHPDDGALYAPHVRGPRAARGRGARAEGAAGVKRARADAVRLPFWQLLALRSQGLPNGDWWERVGAEFNLLTARDPARYWRPYKRHELALREQAVRRGVTRAAMKCEVCGAAFQRICSDRR